MRPRFVGSFRRAIAPCLNLALFSFGWQAGRNEMLMTHCHAKRSAGVPAGFGKLFWLKAGDLFGGTSIGRTPYREQRDERCWPT